MRQKVNIFCEQTRCINNFILFSNTRHIYLSAHIYNRFLLNFSYNTYINYCFINVKISILPRCIFNIFEKYIEISSMIDNK